MTNLQTNPWSETLRQQTRSAIEDIKITADCCIHFKHQRLGFATAAIEDLIQDALVLVAKDSEIAYPFEGIEDLLAAGWAVD